MGEAPRRIEPANGLDELKTLLFQDEAKRLATIENEVSRIDARVGDDDALAVGLLEHGVLDVGADREREVARQRPRRGRPHQEVRPGVRPGGQCEAHVDGGIGDRLVTLGELVVGQGGAAAWAVRRQEGTAGRGRPGRVAGTGARAPPARRSERGAAVPLGWPPQRRRRR